MRTNPCHCRCHCHRHCHRHCRCRRYSHRGHSGHTALVCGHKLGWATRIITFLSSSVTVTTSCVASSIFRCSGVTVTTSCAASSGTYINQITKLRLHVSRACFPVYGNIQGIWSSGDPSWTGTMSVVIAVVDSSPMRLNANHRRPQTYKHTITQAPNHCVDSIHCTRTCAWS